MEPLWKSYDVSWRTTTMEVYRCTSCLGRPNNSSAWNALRVNVMLFVCPLHSQRITVQQSLEGRVMAPLFQPYSSGISNISEFLLSQALTESPLVEFLVEDWRNKKKDKARSADQPWQCFCQRMHPCMGNRNQRLENFIAVMPETQGAETQSNAKKWLNMITIDMK